MRVPVLLAKGLLVAVGPTSSVPAQDFHFLAASTSTTFGPFPVPAGLTVDALVAEFAGGVPLCSAPVVRHTTQ